MRSATSRRSILAILSFLGPAFTSQPSAAQLGVPVQAADPVRISASDGTSAHATLPALLHSRNLLDTDLAALDTFRPGYGFWQHIFTVPDGFVAFGSARDGRLLALFPTRGDWTESARWEEPAAAAVLDGVGLEANLTRRRQQVAELLEAEVGRTVHNETRGNFLLPNARRYGTFLNEWGAIYERFGVPAEIGLAQAILESGLNGRVRSEAGALGFCQWLEGNWKRLDGLTPHVLEGYNQTTQAPYCAAYLAILATKYGSFIPALSEHHAGGTNVGRVIITGGRLGGSDARQRYLLGSRFVRDLRELAHPTYRDVYETYGPRSYRYAEMVFGNTVNVRDMLDSIPQQRVHAMRTDRSISLSEITRRTGLSVAEARRFNPALVRQVPARATLYLPFHVPEFGADVAFWHRAPSPAYAELLAEFVRLDVPIETWLEPGSRRVLEEFRDRFAATDTEEGDVMATMLTYAIGETYAERRTDILSDYAESRGVRRLYEEGVLQRGALRERAVLGEGVGKLVPLEPRRRIEIRVVFPRTVRDWPLPALEPRDRDIGS